jgi:hypothetical protein
MPPFPIVPIIGLLVMLLILQHRIGKVEDRITKLEGLTTPPPEAEKERP